MWTLLSTGGGKPKSAAYWEGWQAVELKRQCTFTTEVDRRDWAKGFADGVAEARTGKVWYKSRTLIIGFAMLVGGLGLVAWGVWADGGKLAVGAGTGISGTSVVMAALRLITATDITLRPHEGHDEH